MAFLSSHFGARDGRDRWMGVSVVAVFVDVMCCFVLCVYICVCHVLLCVLLVCSMWVFGADFHLSVDGALPKQPCLPSCCRLIVRSPTTNVRRENQVIGMA